MVFKVPVTQSYRKGESFWISIVLISASFEAQHSQKEGFPGGSVGKESGCSVGDLDSIPGSGRSLGKGHGNPLQYSSLENPMDRGAWWATVHGVANSWT